MTKTARRLWGQYARELANLIGLRDWTIHLMHSTPDHPGARASVSTVYGRKHAELYLAADWELLNPRAQRAYVVHELLHVQRAQADSYVQHTLNPILGREYESWFEGYRQHLEYVVDGLTDNLARFLPLPPEGTKSGDLDPVPPIPSGSWVGAE